MAVVIQYMEGVMQHIIGVIQYVEGVMQYIIEVMQYTVEVILPFSHQKCSVYVAPTTWCLQQPTPRLSLTSILLWEWK